MNEQQLNDRLLDLEEKIEAALDAGDTRLYNRLVEEYNRLNKTLTDLHSN